MAGPRSDSTTADPKALGEFLRARRNTQDPGAVGLLPGSRRRTPGLRREEVAALANISVQYLIRLERGSHAEPSVHVLLALARVLGLDAPARTHMLRLAGRSAGRSITTDRRDVPDAVRLVVANVWPAIALVLNRRRDILVRNAAFDALIGASAEMASAQPNLMRLVFGDPAARRLWQANWPRAAADAVAHLRDQLPEDAEEPVVDALAAGSAEFAALWRRHDVSCICTPVQVVSHPVVGVLPMTVTTMAVDDGDLQLVLWMPANPAAARSWSDYLRNPGLRLVAGDP